MSLKIGATKTPPQPLSRLGNAQGSNLKHSFFTGCSHLKDFVWSHRYIAFPLIGIALATIYFARRYFSSKSPTIRQDPPPTPKTYNPTTPAPAAQPYPKEPLFKPVEARDVLQLQGILQNTNPSHAPLSLVKIQQEDVLPTQMLQIDNITYYCSSPFMFGQPDGRIAVFALCVVDGKAYPRLFYFSQSQGLWRVLPEVVKVDYTLPVFQIHPHLPMPPRDPNAPDDRPLGHFGKGKDEVDTILPIELNVALSKAFLAKSSTFPRLDQKVKVPDIIQTAPGGGMYYALCTKEYLGLIQRVEDEKPNISGKPIQFTDMSSDNSPDFSRPLIKDFYFWSPLYGDMKGDIYPSRNDGYRFLFCQVINPSTSTIYQNAQSHEKYGDFDSLRGKAFLAAIEIVHENSLTIFGNREFYVRVKDIDLPLLEYPKQIPGDSEAVKGSPQIKKYTCAWNVVCENTLVKEWYKAQQRDPPPAYIPEQRSN